MLFHNWNMYRGFFLNKNDSDVKIDVCVLNPPEETPVTKLSRKDFDQIELYTNISVEKNGNPVLTVGCTLNKAWVPMTYQQPYKWWDRLSKKPKRFYYTPKEPIFKVKKRFNNGYDCILPRVYNNKPKNEIIEQEIKKPVYKCNGEEKWWDRLNTLPTRKVMYRQCIYQKYETLLQNLKNEISKKEKKHHLKEDKNKLRAKIEEVENVKSMSDIRDLLQLELDEVKGNLSLSFDGLSVIQEECENELFISQRDSQQSINEKEDEGVEDKIDEQENTSLDNEDLERTLENSIIAVEEFEESNDEASGNKIVDGEKRQSIKIEEDTLERSMLEQEQNDVDKISCPSQKSTPSQKSEIDTNELLEDIDLSGLDFNYEDIPEKGDNNEITEKENSDKLSKLETERIKLEEEKLKEEVKKAIKLERVKQEEEELKKKEEIANLEAETRLTQDEEKDEVEKQRLEELEAPCLQQELVVKQRKRDMRKTKKVREIHPQGQPWWERLSKPRRSIPQQITYIPPLKRFKRKNKYWVPKSDQNWVDRLSKPRQPIIKKEVFKPKRFEISKHTRHILQHRKQNNEWWDRLSQPNRQIINSE